MANNRAYIVCDGCGHMLMLAKSMGVDWYSPRGDPDVAAFMNVHVECSDWSGCTEPIAFSLRFEFHPDKARELPRDTQ